jgi:tetratricopeptide (TPR) repeat protein
LEDNLKKIHFSVPILFLAFLLTTTTIALAQSAEETPGQLGRVSFANSCAPTVQVTFERAVALLHSFWWQEGERTFREVIERDPNCAIAAWGIATILIGNPFASGPSLAQAQQAIEIIEHGLAIDSKTERERLYIEAVAQYYENFTERSHAARIKSLSDAFENVTRRLPEDDEAQIFSALYLRATQDPADKTFSSALKAVGILEPQFEKYPNHPGVAHYLIHCYDYPPIAEKGLNAAQRYSEIAPSAPHALHMPSHIFTRVGNWEDSVASNLRSESVAKAEGEFADQLHAMDYLVYAYLQLARDRDAHRLVREAPDVQANEQVRMTPYALAAIPARYAIERSAWNEAAQLQIQETQFPYTAAMTHFARALGAARSGDLPAAERDALELAHIAEAMKSANNTYWAVEVEVQHMSAEAWVLFAQDNLEGALTLMRDAADLEETSEKAAVSPGRLLPARELLGDMLLESGRTVEALAEYEQSHDHDPNRFRTLYGAGQAAVQAGNHDKAQYYFNRLIEMAGSGDNRSEMEQVRRYLARKEN